MEIEGKKIKEKWDDVKISCDWMGEDRMNEKSIFTYDI